MNDITLRGARVVDGTGSPWLRADVGVRDGLIVEVGAASPARWEVDAQDRTLAPGFIDMHSHNDVRLLLDPGNAMKVAQGVTTEVLGQDGLSCAPVLRGGESLVEELVAPIDGRSDEGPHRTVADFLKRLDGRAAVNVCFLLPHGTLRGQLTRGEDRALTEPEIGALCDLVADGMHQGAFGVSTGLEYVPARRTEFVELVRVVKEAAAAGGIYVTHIRDYNEHLHEAIDEALEVGSASGSPVHFSHFAAWGRPHHGTMPALLGRLEHARSEGIDATLDVYPYEAASTYATYFCPDELRVLPRADRIADLRDRGRRAGLAAMIDRGPMGIDVGWDAFRVANGNAALGAGSRSLLEIAKDSGESVGEVLCRLLDLTELEATLIVDAYLPEDVEAAIAHPLATIGSDGIPVGDLPHPRGWGAFPRVLRRYVRERRALGLEAAIAMMTGRCAARLGLPDRGLIRPGMAADLLLFDPEAVVDTATFEEPTNLAEGLDLVLVNGSPVWQEGETTGRLPGRALRPRPGRRVSP